MLKVLSLFSGIGGIELGLQNTGYYEISAFCEKDKYCQKILKKHWPLVPIFSDIELLNKEQIKDKIDLITGGFPCTDISHAGKLKGMFDDNGKLTRSGLWKHYARVINEIRPKFCIIENVSNLRKNGIGIVLNDLARIGYDVEWSTISAHSVGYPHQRQRMFFIAYPTGFRQHEHIKQKRFLQIDKYWENTTLYKNREKHELEFIEVCPILSKGSFENIRNTYPNETASLSKVCRVTHGIPIGMDEFERKKRIKHLGNAVVPRIAEIIGKAIKEVL